MIEIEELVRLRILENDVEHLHRFLDKGMLSEDMVRLIFGWKKDDTSLRSSVAALEDQKPANEPVIVKPPQKPLTSKKAEMMAKVKKLHLEGLNGKQIADKTGLSEGTVSTYRKEMGLIPISSMTEISGPVPGGGRV